MSRPIFYYNCYGCGGQVERSVQIKYPTLCIVCRMEMNRKKANEKNHLDIKETRRKSKIQYLKNREKRLVNKDKK
jgi:hypothetical protein